jgi:hypothetical protein
MVGPALCCASLSLTEIGHFGTSPRTGGAQRSARPTTGAVRQHALQMGCLMVLSVLVECYINGLFIIISSVHICSGNGAPGRTGAQTLSSNYQPTRWESGDRGSAAGGETIIERRQWRGVACVGTEYRWQHQQTRDHSDIRRAELAFGKQADQAKMLAGRSILMHRLVEGRAGCEGAGKKEENHQQSRESCLCH